MAMTSLKRTSGSEKLNSEHIVINIWIDSYDEMFSDFDPRAYSSRAISDDFILQVRKISKDQYGKKMILKLLLPETARNQQNEEVISERLQHFFEINHQQLLAEKRKTRQKGSLLTIAGILLLLGASYISYLKSESFYSQVLLILFEAAGWFMLWMGFDQLVYNSGKTKKEFNFYAYMAKAEITFESYNEVSKMFV